MIRRSVAAAQLAGTRKTADVARALAVDTRTVASWRSGQKTPSDHHARDLQRLYGIDVNDWHRYPEQPEQAAQAPGSGNASTPAAAGGQEAQGALGRRPDASPRGTLLDPISRLRAIAERDLRALESDIAMPTTARVKLSGQLSAIMARLARAQAITEQAIVESEAWQAVLETAARALTPDALRALSQAIERDARAEHGHSDHLKT